MSCYTYSVIIPHKNAPELLAKCINSIPELDDVQIIVVDDNSDEHIVDFGHFPCSEYPNVEVYLTKESKGAGYARNVGMNHAKGKWLLFADADDYYTDELIKLFEYYRNINDVDIVYFNCYGGDSLINRCEMYNSMMNDYMAGKKDSINKIKYNWWVPWNKMFNSNFIKEHSLLFEEVMSGNDAKFCLLASYYAVNINIDTNMYYVSTIQPKSITTSKKTFDETLKYLTVMMRIWNFLILVDTPSWVYKSNIIGFNKLRSLIKQYGLKSTIKYIIQYYKEKKMKNTFPELMNR